MTLCGANVKNVIIGSMGITFETLTTFEEASIHADAIHMFVGIVEVGFTTLEFTDHVLVTRFCGAQHCDHWAVWRVVFEQRGDKRPNKRRNINMINI